MAVVSHKARLHYVVVPKAACTSIKTFFADLDGISREHPRGIVDRLLGRRQARERSVHQIDGYVTGAFDAAETLPAGYTRIAVLRDPLARLYSAWSNKATAEVFEQRGERAALASAGLSSDPTFGAFLDGYEQYRAISQPAMIHTRPLRWHLGDDLGAYDRLFHLEALRAFEDYVAERAGVPVRLARENRGEAEARPLGFEARHVDVARRILAPDYAFLAGHYDFDAGLDSFQRRHALAA